ncbi:fimbria/pilus periplasmic chaperone [Enterobacter mori]|uniref:Fimbria/pilus periplasmic chaperone n=1 Tax=Enterobacter mori TaxID=539813 RepID=A0A7T0H012_9ENTR|nr:fimbria/pilus periplasmic chaperone [Enterobacter mori]QPJ99575.1 fimbria/pilus periplasmic chaperone [Enterobacter mori]
MSVKFVTAGMLVLMLIQTAHAAIALDRTRVIFDGRHNSETMTITNQNKELPYLAQSWVENESGEKISSPLIALPPLQRVEPGAKSQVKVQTTRDVSRLSQDKESLFYFNVREIPPKGKKPNTLQIALQTRVKMFYRPAALALNNGDIPQKALTMSHEGNIYRLNNPTGYYITIVKAGTSEDDTSLKNFKALMIPPKGSVTLSDSPAELGNHPVLTYINDWGGRPKLIFSCNGSTCTVTDTRAG